MQALFYNWMDMSLEFNGKKPHYNSFISHLPPIKPLDVVIINSQWWNHPHEKPIPSSDVCSIAGTDNFNDRIGRNTGRSE
jgi:hypothetical protein